MIFDMHDPRRRDALGTPRPNPEHISSAERRNFLYSQFTIYYSQIHLDGCVLLT